LNQEFDYIIAGAGAAGLSLALYILEEPALKDKQVLILDKHVKNSNDRTWCFWQKEFSPFDKILHASWDELYFHSPVFSKVLEIQPYRYKMLRSRDFYEFCLGKIKESKNFSFVQDDIKEMMADGTVICQGQTFKGKYIFNSAFVSIPKTTGKHHLLQHFTGWFVKSPEAIFDPQRPVLMDFRIDQKGDCRFMYVLPKNEHQALVEYTIFSDSLLEEAEYKAALETYCREVLKLDSYEIEETEYGVIPMTNEPIPKTQSGHVINIGTAGGHTKASTGYTFAFIQKKCRKIAANLADNKLPLDGLDSKFDKYLLYDSIFLRVLSEKNFPAWRVFSELFEKLPPKTVFDFLDENTSLLTDIRVMNSTHIPTFLKAALKEVL
jgi:lycopene beta-cyclase